MNRTVIIASQVAQVGYTLIYNNTIRFAGPESSFPERENAFQDLESCIGHSHLYTVCVILPSLIISNIPKLF